MRTYLDPHVYLYDTNEWASHAFVARLQSLVEALLRIKAFEERSGTEIKLVNFRVSENEAGDIYSYNPFLNIPEIAQHYAQLFHSQVFPELIQRFIICPTEECNTIMDDEIPPPTMRTVGDVMAQKFIDGREVCRICSNREPAVLLKHSDRESVGEMSPFFDHKIDLSTALELVAVDPANLFPDVDNNSIRNNQLRLAIELERLNAGLMDSEWLDAQITDVEVMESFWKSLGRAEFGGLEYRYKRRIINSLLQITTGRSTSAYLHRMTSQTITYGGTTINRWNAYVFQSGASDQDRRCSRIYYGKTRDKIILETYDPDAH